MYQVVASDLDGTLLSPDHTLSPYAKETLKLLTARGINFVFATGRHHVDVGQIRDNLEIKSYMITSNGARVHDLDGNLIFAHNLDRDIASDLFGVVNDNPDIITNVYRDDEWFMNRHRPEEMRFFKEAVFQYALYEPGLLEPEGVSPSLKSVDNTLLLIQMVAARMGIAALPHWVVESFERQGLVVTKTLGEGLWSRLYAAVRDGEQRQPVTEAFIRSARNHACDHLPFVKSAERPTYDAPTVRPGSPARL